MRIIAGTARGVRLAQPKGRDIRPTLDRVREAFFSIIGPALPGCRFLDLYAGTGANGLEALSRGAAHAELVESDKIARALIAENAAKTKLGAGLRVHALNLPEGLRRLPHEAPYDFIYADPPHSYTDFVELLALIEAADLLAPGGTIVLEHATRTPAPEDTGRLVRTRTATYGETTLSFFHAKTDVSADNEAA
jgi:16S rRNA (guanine966-N2)-methyltransferase